MIVVKTLPTKFYAPTKATARHLDIVKSWWNHEKHDSEVLDDVLRQIFGRRKWLFDASRNHAARVRFGIVTTTSYDSELCAFSNYQGCGTRTSDEAMYGSLLYRI